MNSPKQIAVNYLEIGKNKVNTPLFKAFLLAILAGAFIAFAGVASTVASLNVQNGFATLVKGCVFPVGLILVVLCGSELFTGNCLLVMPLLHKDVKLGRTALFLAVVYVGNFVGACLVAIGVKLGGAMNVSGLETAFVTIATAKSSFGFGKAVVLGILCNVLVCLAVWISMASTTVIGKIAGVFFPIAAFVICGFEHSIANMFYLSAGLLFDGEGTLSASGLMLDNLLPVTLGNVVGGALVGIFYYVIYVREPKQKPAETPQN